MINLTTVSTPNASPIISLFQFLKQVTKFVIQISHVKKLNAYPTHEVILQVVQPLNNADGHLSDISFSNLNPHPICISKQRMETGRHHFHTYFNTRLEYKF